MADFETNENDSLPSFAVQLLRNGRPFDITDATNVYFIWQRQGTSIRKEGVFVDKTASSVKYDWHEGDMAPKGVYRMQVQLLFPGDKKWTFPRRGYLTWNLQAVLG